MSTSRNLLKTTMLTASLAILASCNGGGGGGSFGGGGTSGGSTGGSTLGNYQSPSVTVSAFVSALNNIEGSGQNSSYVELYEDETYRSAIAGQDEWFVIYDDKFNEYKAVSLQYIRSIVYYDYFANTSALADEFRAIESDDILSGEVNGDYYGDDYEVVDYESFSDTFFGRNSGYAYEDGAATTDTSVMTAELQQKEFIKKAAKISHAFSVGIETSLSLVTLGQKAEKMLSKSGGELTVADQAAFASDLTRLTGVSLSEVMAAANSQQAQDDLVSKIAKKIGTSASNLENRILPELLGVKL
ncbi:MAG TPA: hypothetical protein VNJ01_11040 [Bacteriovoracaceae bacterium]|nr:hypothetical protein [Bacteriovoracaceae bacterium]